MNGSLFFFGIRTSSEVGRLLFLCQVDGCQA